MALLRRILPRRTWAWMAPLAAALLASGGASPAQHGPLSAQEYEVKAAFLYNFAKFVEWPPTADGKAPLIILVFGRNPFGAALERTVSGKAIGDRLLVVRRTSRVQELMPCHLLFIGAEQNQRMPEILKAIGEGGVLTVSEMEDFLELGGTVELVLDDNKVRFAVNLEAARRSGLKISSKLLSLARAVKR